LVRRSKTSFSRQDAITTSEGRIVTLGNDGLLLELDFQAAPCQKLVVDLTVEPGMNAQLLLETRWQRRLGVKRWHVGALIQEMRLRKLPY
jgi:hypothetical protein